MNEVWDQRDFFRLCLPLRFLSIFFRSLACGARPFRIADRRKEPLKLAYIAIGPSKVESNQAVERGTRRREGKRKFSSMKDLFFFAREGIGNQDSSNIRLTFVSQRMKSEQARERKRTEEPEFDFPVRRPLGSEICGSPFKKSRRAISKAFSSFPPVFSSF